MVDAAVSMKKRGDRRPPRFFGFSGWLLDRDQVDRGGLAAPVDLELEFDPVALVQRDHAGALDRGDVDERVRLAVVAGDKAEALGCVEELDRARGLLAGQLALGPALARTAGTATAAILDRE